MSGAVSIVDAPPSAATLYIRALATVVAGRKGGDALPQRRVAATIERVDPDRVAEYARVCGFRLRDELPVTFPHVLAFPLALSLMTADDFPFPLLGLVHAANRIEQKRWLRLDDSWTFTAWAENLQPHRRGRTFDIVQEAAVDGEVLWLERSTYLARGGSGGTGGEARTSGEQRAPEGERYGVGARLRIPADIGRRYAAVSGDRNPIHLSALSARPFGFKRAIAHGMWTKARCLAALEGRLPGAFDVEVSFRKPLFIPGKARLVTRKIPGGWDLALTTPDGTRPHLLGTIHERGA